MVKKGQTGAERLPKWLNKFIGFTEILGEIPLIAPMLINKLTILIPISSICFGFIMIPAAYFHIKRKESKNVIINTSILIV